MFEVCVKMHTQVGRQLIRKASVSQKLLKLRLELSVVERHDKLSVCELRTLSNRNKELNYFFLHSDI